MNSIKDQILIVKYFKKGKNELFASQILSASNFQDRTFGNQIPKAYWGTDFIYHKTNGWSLRVGGRNRKFMVDRKLSVNSDISLSVHRQEKINLKPTNLDKIGPTVPKIQLLVQDLKGSYIYSDILRYKRSQKIKFAGHAFKIRRPKSLDWESVYNREGLKFSVRQTMVPKSSDIKSPIAFNPFEKKLMKKIAVGYVAAIAFFFISYAVGTLISDYFKGRNKYDVVKIDENFLEQKRQKLFQQKQEVLPVAKKIKKVKSANVSKKIVKGFSKKRIALKKSRSSGTSGPKTARVRVQGIKSNRMKVSRGKSGGAKGYGGQQDKTVSKISNKLSALSQGIGFNSKSKQSASHLYKVGRGGSASSLKKGFSRSKKGLGFGGGGKGSKGLGSYKIGGLNTNSLGGFERSAGTGQSLSAGRAGRGYISGIEEEIIIVGGLDRSVIKRVINKNLGDINYCYERRLNVRPNLSGVFKAKFNVGANGQVLRSTFKSTLGDSKLNKCINNSIKTWKFPKPLGGTVVNVNYPFILKSS